MKKQIAVLLFLITTSTVWGQHRHGPPTKAEERLSEYYYQCVHRNTYSAAQRLKFYPFSRTAKVVLVSFFGFMPPEAVIKLDSVEISPPINKANPVVNSKYMGFDTVGKLKYPFENSKVDTSAFMERKKLTRAQVNKLTDILYNIDKRPSPPGVLEIADPGRSCYNPRNAILFLDANGKIFAWIEICFECERFELHPEKIKMGGWCDDKFIFIKNYFKTVGIEWGITKKD